MSKIIGVQTILYNTEPDWLDKFLECLAACGVPQGYKLALALGDCSAYPLLNNAALGTKLQKLGLNDIEFQYSFFNENIGFSRGHNRLYRASAGLDLLLLLNPDTVFPYHLIERLVEFAHRRPDFGIVEARQLPLEHPKTFDEVTLETGWASGACCLINAAAYRQVKGFDEVFFMYCEDVDLSWRIRAAGYKIYYCPASFIYHSKRLVSHGMDASYAEQLYGPVSSLLLRTKYGRSDLNQAVVTWLTGQSGQLPVQILERYNTSARDLIPATAREQAVAYFSPDGNFAKHRWHYSSIQLSSSVLVQDSSL